MPATLLILQGEAAMTLGSDRLEAHVGTWVHMPPNMAREKIKRGLVREVMEKASTLDEAVEIIIEPTLMKSYGIGLDQLGQFGSFKRSVVVLKAGAEGAAAGDERCGRGDAAEARLAAAQVLDQRTGGLGGEARAGCLSCPRWQPCSC